jgi:DDE superfamily endonuclease/Helix-turn-helix of DDE superfamily endonuclease
LSSRTLNHLADRIRGHRNQRRSRWRRLDSGRQALLALAHLRNGDTYTRLAAGLEIGVSTAWRYVQEATALLAQAADDLTTVMQRIRLLAYAILDGTLIPIDRVADRKPYYSGKHKRHGVNVQVIADAAGRLVWASPALPGSVHDLTAARAHGIIEVLTSAEVMTFADKGYQGARGQRADPVQTAPLPAQTVTPAEDRKPGPREDPRPRRTRDRHPQDPEILAKLRCCPRRATAIVQAILVLHHVEPTATQDENGSVNRRVTG